MALLERDGRRVRLTPAAEGLVVRADRVLLELDAAEAELAAEQQTVRGNIVIGAFPTAGSGIVAPALRDLREQHPDLHCACHEHEPEDGIALLRSGRLDVLVSESYEDVAPAPIGGLEQHLLLSEPLLLVLPEADRAREPVDLTRLRNAPWIAGLPGTQFARALDQTCRAAGFTPEIGHHADDAALHVALVEAGCGVGLLPAMACSASPRVRFARASPAPPRRQVSALVRRGATQRPALSATLDALLRHASGRRDWAEYPTAGRP